MTKVYSHFFTQHWVVTQIQRGQLISFFLFAFELIGICCMYMADNILCFIDMARKFKTFSGINSSFYVLKKTVQQRTAVK